MQVFAGEFRRVVIGRLSEWQCATATMAFGAILLAPTSIYSSGAAWVGFSRWIDEATLGGVMLAVGIARLAVLGVNGWWRPSYYLRAVGACTSMAVWLMISLGFASSGYIGTWAAIYPLMAVVAGINTFRAMDDAKHMELARRAAQAFGARHAPHPA